MLPVIDCLLLMCDGGEPFARIVLRVAVADKRAARLASSSGQRSAARGAFEQAWHHAHHKVAQGRLICAAHEAAQDALAALAAVTGR